MKKKILWILLTVLLAMGWPMSGLADTAKRQIEVPSQSYIVATASIYPVLGPYKAPERMESPNIVLGRAIALKNGITGQEWKCLYDLGMVESGWSETSLNKSSAYGIFQFLDSTWAGTGIARSSDPATQIRAGLIYIKNRYKTPCNAYNFQRAQSPHWY